jgi:hypothetical protein
MKTLLGKGHVPGDFSMERAVRRVQRIVNETKEQ